MAPTRAVAGADGAVDKLVGVAEDGAHTATERMDMIDVAVEVVSSEVGWWWEEVGRVV